MARMATPEATWAGNAAVEKARNSGSNCRAASDAAGTALSGPLLRADSSASNSWGLEASGLRCRLLGLSGPSGPSPSNARRKPDSAGWIRSDVIPAAAAASAAQGATPRWRSAPRATERCCGESTGRGALGAESAFASAATLAAATSLVGLLGMRQAERRYHRQHAQP